MKNDPWHVKLRRWWRLNLWFARANWRHRISWVTSKKYRKSYGDCDCFTTGRKITKEHCDNNPKCNLRKAQVSYIEV